MTDSTAEAAAAPAAGNTLAGLRSLARARWGALAPRERRLVAAAALVVGLFVAWLVLVQPALRTLRSAPAQLDALDAQIQQMQRLAAEVRTLRAAPPVAPAQSAEALQAATQRLGARGRLTLQGDRATLTLDGVATDTLADWLADARNAARARPLEAQLVRVGQGYNGTIVLQLGGAR